MPTQNELRSGPAGVFALGLALLALIPITVIIAAEPSPVPTKFRAHIGGFLGGDYVVELRDGALTYSARGRDRGAASQVERILPTSAQWLEFRRSLDELNVWQWKGDYANQKVRDGTQWSIDLAYADRSLASMGSNNFPDSTGRPNGKPETTESFKRYLAAVTRVLGGRAFE